MLNPSNKIYIAGHRGLVWSAVVRQLRLDGFTVVLTATDFEGQDTAALLHFVNAMLAARQESHAGSRVEITTPPTPAAPPPERPLAGLG